MAGPPCCRCRWRPAAEEEEAEELWSSRLTRKPAPTNWRQRPGPCSPAGAAEAWGRRTSSAPAAAGEAAPGQLPAVHVRLRRRQTCLPVQTAQHRRRRDGRVVRRDSHSGRGAVDNAQSQSNDQQQRSHPAHPVANQVQPTGVVTDRHSRHSRPAATRRLHSVCRVASRCGPWIISTRPAQASAGPCQRRTAGQPRVFRAIIKPVRPRPASRRAAASRATARCYCLS